MVMSDDIQARVPTARTPLVSSMLSMEVELEDAKSVAEFFAQLAILFRHGTKVRVTVDFPPPPPAG